MRSGRVALAGVASVVAVPILIVGPLRHSPPIWNATNVTETLTGRVIQNGTNLTQIVSFVGQAEKPQRLVVRADLLVLPTQGTLKSTALQLEYLPSGDICSGKVTNVGQADFAGTCRMPNGETRSITANWGPNAAGNGVIGQIQLSG